jgi:hypothetical protein
LRRGVAVRYAPDMSPNEERPARAKRRKKSKRTGGLIGLGLDAQDGHKRITKGEDFLVVGGSEETHGRMTDIALRMKKCLQERGQTFGELTPSEFEDLSRDCLR